jgi:hypothetical protein
MPFVAARESVHGPSRHFVAAQQFSRFRCRADITRLAADTTPVANDPKRTYVYLSASLDLLLDAAI